MVQYGIVNHTNEDKMGLIIRGHANFGKKGQDIVCAAVSAIGQTAAIGVSKYDEQTEVKHMSDGYISFICAKTPETSAIIDAAVTGLGKVAEQYPQFVREM